MDDLISRQAAIDALEKVAELYPWRVPGDRDSYSQYNEAWQDALNRADSEIEELPSAQPEIIRCNSCKYWTQATGKMKGYGLGRCDFHDADLVTCNGFCYWAERRIDDH